MQNLFHRAAWCARAVAARANLLLKNGRADTDALSI
jgi:hypothetical protein